MSEPSVQHEMIGMGDCSCGWMPILGEGVLRSFDKHLREMAEIEGTTPPPLICRTALCRVVTFQPSRHPFEPGNTSTLSANFCPACAREGQGW